MGRTAENPGFAELGGTERRDSQVAKRSDGRKAVTTRH